MTVYDLLFLALLATAIVALCAALLAALRGRRERALQILGRIALSAAIYIGIVYAVTALSDPVVLQIGEPRCSDDWCLAVENVRRTPKNGVTAYDVTLRIFSRARRRAQRENIASDVYLVDANWTRYHPILSGDEIPLNTLLQPGESVTTHRTFELPSGARQVRLLIGHHPGLPVCLIIGECGAFHKETAIHLD